MVTTLSDRDEPKRLRLWTQQIGSEAWLGEALMHSALDRAAMGSIWLLWGVCILLQAAF